MLNGIIGVMCSWLYTLFTFFIAILVQRGEVMRDRMKIIMILLISLAIVGCGEGGSTVSVDPNPTVPDSSTPSVDPKPSVVPTHKANLFVVYSSDTNIAQIRWSETSYQDTEGYKVEKRGSNSSWTAIARLASGSGSYSIQDHTLVASRYRIVSLSDKALLSGDNENTELLVDPLQFSSIYFTKDDVNVTMPLNRVVTINTLTDSTDIQKVTYYLDTKKIGESTTKPNFPLILNSASVSNGNHRLDHELKIDDSSYIIFNTPISTYNTNLSLSLSLKNQTGLIPVVVRASSKEKISGVRFYLDGLLVAEIEEKNYCTNIRYGCYDQNDSYMWEWDTTTYAPISYTIRAEVSDAGGEHLSTKITHALNNPPVLLVTSPINDSVVGNTLTISGSVSDDQNDVTVTIKIGSQTIYSSNSSTFSTTYYMNGLAENIYTVEIKATDPDNKSTTIRRNVLYKADSDYQVWKTVGKENNLLKINNGYLVTQNAKTLTKQNLSTEVYTSYDLSQVRYQRIYYLDVHTSGKILFHGSSEKRVNQMFLADDDLSVISEGKRPFIKENKAMWLGNSIKIETYSFDTQTLNTIDRITSFGFSGNTFWNSKQICTSARDYPSSDHYNLYIYNIANSEWNKLTDTVNIAERCEGIDDTRVLSSSSPKSSSDVTLYYADLVSPNLRVKLSTNYSKANLVDGVIAWVERDENTLYVLYKNETIPRKIVTDAYLGELKNGVLTYTKDSKLYLYKDGVSKEIWSANDIHYIDGGYVYIIRGADKLIYRVSI